MPLREDAAGAAAAPTCALFPFASALGALRGVGRLGLRQVKQRLEQAGGQQEWHEPRARHHDGGGDGAGDGTGPPSTLQHRSSEESRAVGGGSASR